MRSDDRQLSHGPGLRPARGEFRCGGPGEATGDAALQIDAARDDAPITDDAPIIDSSTVDAPMIDAPMIDAPIDAPPVMHIEYVAVVADCVNPLNPNPTTCTNVNGPSQLAVAGRTVTSLKLRTVATSDAKANANNTGQVWRVDPFARADLFNLLGPNPPRLVLDLQ